MIRDKPIDDNDDDDSAQKIYSHVFFHPKRTKRMQKT